MSVYTPVELFRKTRVESYNQEFPTFKDLEETAEVRYNFLNLLCVAVDTTHYEPVSYTFGTTAGHEPLEVKAMFNAGSPYFPPAIAGLVTRINNWTRTTGRYELENVWPPILVTIVLYLERTGRVERLSNGVEFKYRYIFDTVYNLKIYDLSVVRTLCLGARAPIPELSPRMKYVAETMFSEEYGFLCAGDTPREDKDDRSRFSKLQGN